MASRPLVSVHSAEKASEVVGHATLPGVMVAPIRPDVVAFVHTNMAKNARQAYAPSVKAGEQTSAQSWGTGRAVSRIPRVSGGGTHRAGQAAFGNMCRGGRMFAPNKVWRRWHRQINVNQKRYAVASALAASALPSLVMARGHKIDNLVEVPLVVSNNAEALTKTAAAAALLKRLGAHDDVEKSLASRQIRSGKGKMRNRRHVQRRGPLVVYENDNGIVKAFRNLPGVELAQVSRLNLLQLAPGGHLGRFTVWTQGAFEALDKIYGTNSKSGNLKGYALPRCIMTNADLTRIINSDEIQSVVKTAKKPSKYIVHKKNPLKNLGAMIKLNPAARGELRGKLIAEEKNAKARAELVERRRKGQANPRPSADKAAHKAHVVQGARVYKQISSE